MTSGSPSGRRVPKTSRTSVIRTDARRSNARPGAEESQKPCPRETWLAETFLRKGLVSFQRRPANFVRDNTLLFPPSSHRVACPFAAVVQFLARLSGGLALSEPRRGCYAAQQGKVPTGVHVLRHTFCSHLVMRGALMRNVQELVGHQDLTMTQRYSH